MNCKHHQRTQYSQQVDGVWVTMETCALCNKFLGKRLQNQQKSWRRKPERSIESVIDRITSYNQPGVG